MTRTALTAVGPALVVRVHRQGDEKAPFARDRAGECQLELAELVVGENGVERTPGLPELPPKFAHGAENLTYSCLLKGTMED